MDAKTVRQHVRQFRQKTAHTGGEEHCFAPWYLHYRYQLPETKAMAQASDGNYDFGVDGFHLEVDGETASLVLVQAKLSESVQLIRKGFKELERTLDELKRALEGIETGEPIQNKVICNLRASLNRLGEDARRRTDISFQVLHLSTEDPAILGNQLREPITRLSEVLADRLPATKCSIRHIGPRDLGPEQILVVPPEHVRLRISHADEFLAGDGGRMFTGVGQVAELVDMYQVRRDDLFSRNVRYFLRKKGNAERGPAAKMRATLKQMCVDATVEPERFAMFHNGITIFSRGVERENGEMKLKDPYVLNGCQTIKNAFEFRHDPNLRAKIDDERWRRVAVPVRVIETGDAELIRIVTVNNNRQNAMSAAALRANDPVQIRLEERFKDRRILYERQEGRFDDLWATRPELLEDEYENTGNAFVDISDIARAISAASGDVGLAMHVNDLFESDSAYERCFNEKRNLRSIVFLTFLQNLHDVVGLVLKKDLGLEPRPGAPKPSRCMYHVICLLARHLAKEKMHDFVGQWGSRLYHRDGDFREAIRKLLNSQKSGIRTEVNRHFMTLESGGVKDLNEALARTASALRLKDNIDPFSVFADLDEQVPVTDDDDE